jgi:hypothetical protein
LKGVDAGDVTAENIIPAFQQALKPRNRGDQEIKS